MAALLSNYWPLESAALGVPLHDGTLGNRVVLFQELLHLMGFIEHQIYVCGTRRASIVIGGVANVPTTLEPFERVWLDGATWGSRQGREA